MDLVVGTKYPPVSRVVVSTYASFVLILNFGGFNPTDVATSY